VGLPLACLIPLGGTTAEFRSAHPESDPLQPPPEITSARPFLGYANRIAAMKMALPSASKPRLSFAARGSPV